MQNRIDIQNMPGHLIRRMNQISVSIFHERLKKIGFDLTSVQFAAMNELASSPGIDQASLAGRIAHDRATIGGVVDRLEAKGFIRREVCKRDRRAREVYLTQFGEKTLEELAPLVEALQDEILVGLDNKERSQFIKLSKK